MSSSMGVVSGSRRCMLVSVTEDRLLVVDEFNELRQVPLTS